MKFRQFIEDNFLIDHHETGQLVPFIFRGVQSKYYDLLCKDYNEQDNFKGAREIILKARKEGMTSMLLALFAADMLTNENPVRYLEISYKDDATRQHFRRIKTYIMSFFEKETGIHDDRELEKLIFKSIGEGSEFVLNHNGASFYVGTASSRTGERGGTTQGILFSEAAHYQDTPILRASEIIEGTKSMVAVGSGMIFQESTANSFNHFKKTWDQAMMGEVNYRPRFFSWREFYTEKEFEEIKKGFSDKTLIKQEFPDNPQEAFLASGQQFFDTASLVWYLENQVKEPHIRVNINTALIPPLFDSSDGVWKIWEEPEATQGYLLSCDFATTNDFSAATILKQKSCEIVATYRGRMDTNELAQNLIAMAKHYNTALIIPEVNGLGLALLQALLNFGYNRIYRRKQQDVQYKDETDRLGFLTTSATRPLMLGHLQSMIAQRSIKIYDKNIIQEMLSFVRNERTSRPEAITGGHDDLIFAVALLVIVYNETLPMLGADRENRSRYGENYEKINDNPFPKITNDPWAIGS